ncbi:MAG TPA: cytochrome c oxidase accessory protein CcoG [Rhodocyclaceae bacterium]
MSGPNTQKQPLPDSGGMYEKYRKVYAREIKGAFTNWRWIMAWLTQLVFYGLCWIEWNGRQAVLFHLVERKFYLFGLVLWPQDVFYLAVLLIISAYGLFLFTAVAGRLFCGYACPQTVYTLIFMWIENRIEGSRNARMKRDAAQTSGDKALRKGAKYLAWTVLSLWTGFTFVGYFTPIHELWDSVLAWTLGPWETFWIFFYAAFAYLMAGIVREQMCKYICPYARFQAVMFDPDTLIISYDNARGEPRGARRKAIDYKAQGLGDCIDCGICVQVCPTGIDIRNGLQLECIACAACVDACDQVMDQMNYPRGLVRYSTENALARHYTRKDIYAHLLRPRTLIYSSILLAITAAMIWSLYARIPFKADVIRDRGSLGREIDDGRIENVYTLRLMNTGEVERRYSIAVSGLPSATLDGETEIATPAAATLAVPIAVRAAPDDGKAGANQIFFEIVAMDDPSIRLREKATFMRP